MDSTPTINAPISGRWWLPWRSATLGSLVAAGILVLGLPLFLRMPLTIDTTLYDVSAREVLRGGAHYRDVFDTNPPGFVWALCAVRFLFGTSMEAVRVVDFAIAGGIVAVLSLWVRSCGAARGTIAWTAAGTAAFYLFVTEFSQTQRDLWMMFPAAIAAWYRVRRVRHASSRTDGWLFRSALLEGAAWGLAVWVKPHVIPIALATWLATQPRLAGSATGSWWRKPRRSLADLTGSLAGGLLVGVGGAAYLLASGSWPYMIDVFTNWAPTYFDSLFIKSEIEFRKDLQLRHFPPWSTLLLVAVPLALLNVIDGKLWAGRDTSKYGPMAWILPSWLYDRTADADARFARAVLAVVYLSWVAITFVFQKPFQYAHVPETLLMLGLLAANRWAIVVPVTLFHITIIVWCSLYGPPPHSAIKSRAVVYWHLVWPRPDRGPDRLQWWPGCFSRAVPEELRNGVAYHSRDYGPAVDRVQLAEVVEFLRSQGVREGDDTVMCCHDSPHVIYLELKLRPPIRFMHLSTAEGLQPLRVKEEITAAAPRVRFVVGDLKRVSQFFPGDKQTLMELPGPGPDLLPPVVPRGTRTIFPMNQPTVFRSGGGRGRYVVHRLVNPVGEVIAPFWDQAQ